MKTKILLAAFTACIALICASCDHYYGGPSGPGADYGQWHAPSRPTYAVEVRNGLSGMWRNNKELIFEFEYDSIRPGRWPVGINKLGKYVLITEDDETILGPFQMIDTRNEDYLLVKTDTANGVIYPQGTLHPQGLFVNIPYAYAQLISPDLFWVKDKSEKKKGIFYTHYQKGVIYLKPDRYLYAECLPSSDCIDIRYVNYNGDYAHYVINRQGEKRLLMQGNMAEKGILIITDFRNGTAVVKSQGDHRYGLVDLDFKSLVPATYKSYQTVGDSICKFLSETETLVVDRSTGKRLP